MRISVINNCDIEGGAARASFRLCGGLRQSGIDVSMWVQHKDGDHYWIAGPEGILKKIVARVLPHLDILPLSLYPKRQKKYWSVNWLPNPRLDLNRVDEADVVHLNWIGGGFLPIAAMTKLKRPLVWTLHDTWAYTGGCHYNGGCDNFIYSCGSCPQLGSKKPNDLSRKIWQNKMSNWSGLPITIVTPSRWLAGEAKRSSLLRDHRIEVIPNGLDLNVFKPISKVIARQILGLPEEGLFVLFGAMNAATDKNKGYDYLQAALARLLTSTKLNITSLLVFGASEPKSATQFGFPIRFFGRLHDDVALAVLYSAADVMVVPSVQEAFGQTASEAMSCGTPVVSFGATGLLDIVDHMKNGYLSQPYDSNDLARGIEWVLEDAERRKRLSESARLKCEEKFEISLVARQYIELYQSLL
jgi:glycosyltransferase involved in cell wall biosynthesis